LGADQLKPYVKQLAEQAPFFVSVYPNAGLPNAFGQYEQSPQQLQRQIQDYLEESLINIVGGCCGTRPEHIRHLADLVGNYSPRKLVAHEY
jgi:5-methyltetrahydrofolate--homocysteine methyltransferase